MIAAQIDVTTSIAVPVMVGLLGTFGAAGGIGMWRMIARILDTTEELDEAVIPHFKRPGAGGLDVSLPARVARLEVAIADAKDREARQQALDHRLEQLEAELRVVRSQLTTALDSLRERS